MKIRPKAYSYIRISSKRQLDGDGLERQLATAREYAIQNDLDLDTELQDVGSGYHGKHVKFGALGGFLRLAEQGNIPAGSWLLVESLDRLSREDVLIAQSQFIDLLLAGITIATLLDGQVYHKDRDDMQLIMSLAYMMRANDESSTKSERAKSKILKRKQEALEGKKRYNVSLVHWIDQKRIGSSQEYEFILNDHAQTVQRIYELADSGVGTHSIARMLNQSDTPVFRPKINMRNQWRDATVAAILRDETAIGTYKVWQNVDGERVALGEPIKSYYPAAISEELFWRVQRKRPEHPNRGRVGKRFGNLFPRNTTCAHCGGRLKMIGGANEKAPRRFFTCSQRVLTGGIACDTVPKMFRYDELEHGVLTYVTDFHAAASEAMRTKTTDTSRLQRSLKREMDKLSELKRRRNNLLAAIEEEDDPVERAALRQRSKNAREKLEQQTAYVQEIGANIREASEKRQQITDVTEQIQLQRNSWTTGTDEDVLKSRALVAKALRQFISTIEVDFVQQTATVWVSGLIAAYKFDRNGHLIAHFNMMHNYRSREIKRTYSVIKNGRRLVTNIAAPPYNTTPLSLETMKQQLIEQGWTPDQIERSINGARQLIEVDQTDEIIWDENGPTELRLARPNQHRSTNPLLNDPDVIKLKAERQARAAAWIADRDRRRAEKKG